MKNVFVALGSNLGNSLLHIITARKQFNLIPDTRCLNHSGIYRTPALGGMKQPDYMNSVSHLCSSLSASELLMHLHRIEDQQGRKRGKRRWQARTLDLDLLLYGDEIITSPALTVPHYAIAERNFVVFSILELDPDITIPGIGKASSIAAKLKRDDMILVPLEEIAHACP